MPESSFLTHFTDAIATKDPAGGLQLAREINLDSPWNRHFASTFLHKVSDRNLDGVLDVLKDPKFDRPDFPERYGLLALKDPSFAFSEALSRYREDETDRDSKTWQFRGVSSVIKSVAQRDPQAAGKLILGAPESLYSNLFADLGEEWCRRDAPAAAQWARDLPAGKARDLAAREITFLWAKNDSNASASSLDKIPAGSTRDEAIVGFSVATIDTDPDGVLAWTRTVSTSKSRAFALGRAWALWNRKNPKAANDWLEVSGPLKPEEKEMIRTHEF